LRDRQRASGGQDIIFERRHLRFIEPRIDHDLFAYGIHIAVGDRYSFRNSASVTPRWRSSAWMCPHSGTGFDRVGF
jgi:hypothetical protein